MHRSAPLHLRENTGEVSAVCQVSAGQIYGTDQGRLLDKWRFIPGEDTGKLPKHPRAGSAWQEITIPHSVELPDRALWYEMTWADTAAQYLSIRADDGAQVFLDGKRIRCEDWPGWYRIPAGSGKRILQVRVLNNAMSGGLKQVYTLPDSVLDSISHSISRHISAHRLVNRACQLLPPESLASVNWDRPCEEVRNLLEINMLLPLAGVPAFSHAPYWRYIDADTMELSFYTDTQCSAIVQIRESHKKRWQSITAPTYQSTSHKHRLYTAAWSDTILYRLILGGKAISPEYTLVRPRLTGKRSIAIWGDSQGGWDTFRHIAGLIHSHGPDLYIALGDLVATGNNGIQWVEFFRAGAPLMARRPGIFIPGNHDYDGYYDTWEPRMFASWFSGNKEPLFRALSLGDIRILTLDPNANFPVDLDTAQASWLYRELQSPAWQQAAWRIIAVHQPVYAQGWPGYHGEPWLQKLMDTLAPNTLPDLVLSGHAHDYERLLVRDPRQPWMQIVSGGAGGGLEPAGQSAWPEMDRIIKAHHFVLLTFEEDACHVRVYDLQNELIDEILFPKNRTTQPIQSPERKH